LNNHLLDRWLRHGRYYQLNLISGDHKNPEYRIADDVRGSTDAPVDLATGVLNAVLLAATFIGVLWAVGGEVQIKDGAKILLMPQCAYVPTGTLRRAATYPGPPGDTAIETLHRIFELVGLAHLICRIEAEAPWNQILSGGEKQRLAFAHILLHAPDIIVLDEATSALDPPSQDKLMALLTEELHATTFVSVGHRPELEAFHDRKIVLERQHDSARLSLTSS
jgi:ABC-type uncharacterized transport system fused permease/ATPase subunit